MTYSVIINGRFFTRRVTGVERFGRELVSALDSLITGQKIYVGKIAIIAPPNTRPDINLQSISFISGGLGLSGHMWEQIALANMARGRALVSLCNSGPVCHHRQLVVIHDAAVFRYANDFSRRYRVVHKALGRVLAHTARIGTVSRFSQTDLAEVLAISPDSIPIIPNGSDHLLDINSQPSIIESLGLNSTPYFVTVGSRNKRKNLGLVMKAVTMTGRIDFKLIVIGDDNSRVFESGEFVSDNRIVFAGRVSDGALRSLYERATALIFPSRYEGFGIPPLEAFSNNCPVLASSAGAIVEVCGDAAAYFDPDDPGHLAALMCDRLGANADKATWIERGKRRVMNYRWAESAECLLDQIRSL